MGKGKKLWSTYLNMKGLYFKSMGCDNLSQSKAQVPKIAVQMDAQDTILEGALIEIPILGPTELTNTSPMKTEKPFLNPRKPLRA